MQMSLQEDMVITRDEMASCIAYLRLPGPKTQSFLSFNPAMSKYEYEMKTSLSAKEQVELDGPEERGLDALDGELKELQT